MTPTEKILRQARDLIAAPHAWRKGSLEGTTRGHHSYCAVGALQAAGRNEMAKRGKYGFRFLGYRKARRLLDEVAPVSDIVNFNDQPSTKKRDILAAFDAAIEQAAAR